MSFFNTGFVTLLLVSIFLSCEKKDRPQPNVLLIIIDDQNDMIGAFGSKSSLTPNIDRLADQSTVFTNAYCSAPACGPSRASLLSGLLPSTTGVYYNSQPNSDGTSAISNAVYLPQHFKDQGYLTGMYGKIFHEHRRTETHEAMCTPGYFAPHRGFWANIPNDSSILQLTDFRYEGGSNFAWGAVPDDWENKNRKLIDTENTDKLIEVLNESHEKPFFLALGLLRPHLPWIVPQRFFDRFPLESIEVPKGYLKDDLQDLPECAKWMAKEVPGQNIGDGNVHNAIADSGEWKQAIRAYKASTAYTDHQIGRVLDALQSSVYGENTIVVLACDHGYHLGEKEHWTKFGLWEKANRVPMFIKVPGGKGQICKSPVSLLDLYPTLISLTRLNPPVESNLEGVDLSSLIDEPKGSRGRPVLSTYGYQNHSLRTERFRYIRYRNGEEEFYDHSNDPHEWTNLANNPEFADDKAELARFLPKINTPESDNGSNLGWIPEVFEEGYVYSPGSKK